MGRPEKSSSNPDCRNCSAVPSNFPSATDTTTCGEFAVKPSNVKFGNLGVLQSAGMPVSERNSRIVYNGLKRSGVKIISALPETWLVHLINMAEADPDMTLVRLAREEEGIGISAGAPLAGA